MTLTKNDLQAIREIVNTEVRSEVNQSLVRELTPIKNNITSLKRDMTIVKKDIKYMSGKFDAEIVYNRRRVEKIEEHLHLNNN